eukprot:Gb_36327 [translate_table: standard]
MPFASLETGQLNKVWEIKTLGRTRDDEARKLLESVAKQVQPIMQKRKWRVKLLSEFCPSNPSLLGLNVGGGAEIKIRLRRPNRESEFFPYEDLLGTMLHELTHNEHGPHDAKFYKLLDEITKECEELMAKGISGTGQGFDVPGRRLGGFSHNPPLSSLRQSALTAAEKRARLGALAPSGPNRLGGDGEIMRLLTPTQAAAMAAERRLRDDIWCAAPVTSGSDGIQKAREREEAAGGSANSAPGATDTSRKRASVQTLGINTAREKSNINGSILREEDISHGKKTVQFDTRSLESGKENSFLGTSSTIQTFEQQTRNANEDGSTWNCGACTLTNQPLALVCEACGSEKPKEKYKIWSCKACTLQNPVTLEKCSMCNQWRYSYGPPISVRGPNVGT